MNTSTNMTRERFVSAWESHIKQLSSLYLQASTPGTFDDACAEYERVRALLMAKVDAVAITLPSAE